MLELTLESVRALAKKIIVEEGNESKVYVDEDGRRANCKYVHGLAANEEYDDIEKTPGCLIGTMLLDAGIPMDEFRRHNDGAAAELLADLEEREAITYTYEADEYLTRLQEWQDSGKTWGDALEQAEEWANKRQSE